MSALFDTPTWAAYLMHATLKLPWHTLIAWSLVGVLVFRLTSSHIKVRLGRTRFAKRKRMVAKRAARGEVEAAGLLRKHGYKILDTQAEHSWHIKVDGISHEVEMRADYIVKRKGVLYVAEVKTGRVAPRVTCAPTRRQLLEYALAYPVDGVLLVDMETHTLHHVTFPEQKNGRIRSERLPTAICGACAGALLTWALLTL